MKSWHFLIISVLFLAELACVNSNKFEVTETRDLPKWQCDERDTRVRTESWQERIFDSTIPEDESIHAYFQKSIVYCSDNPIFEVRARTRTLGYVPDYVQLRYDGNEKQLAESTTDSAGGGSLRLIEVNETFVNYAVSTMTLWGSIAYQQYRYNWKSGQMEVKAP